MSLFDRLKSLAHSEWQTIKFKFDGIVFMQTDSMTKFLTILLSVVVFCACSDSNPANRRASLPESLGGEYEIVVVVDDEPKDAPHVQALTEALTTGYPMLNQPEPWFVLSWIDVDDVNKFTRKNRNLILLANRDSYGKVRQLAREIFGDEAIDQLEADPNRYSISGSDGWVAPQNIVYMADKDAGALAEKIRKNARKHLDYFEEREFARIQTNLFKYRERIDLELKLKEEMDIKFSIPEVYEPAVLATENLEKTYKALNIDGFKWFYSSGRHAFNNVSVWSTPYSDTVQLNSVEIIKMRDSVLKRFIPCEDEGSYMGTENRFRDLMPQSTTVTLNGNYAVRTIGYWRAIGGFQGGPFINYVVVDEKNGRLVFIDGSVAAKGQPKKKHIIRIKAILSTLQLL